MAALTKTELEESEVRDHFESLAKTISCQIEKDISRVTVVYDMVIKRVDEGAHRTLGRAVIFKRACKEGERHPLLGLKKLPKQLIKCFADGNYLWVKGSILEGPKEPERCDSNRTFCNKYE